MIEKIIEDIFIEPESHGLEVISDFVDRKILGGCLEEEFDELLQENNILYFISLDDIVIEHHIEIFLEYFNLEFLIHF